MSDTLGASTGHTPGHIQLTPLIPVSGCRTPSASSDVSSFSPWSGFHCCPVGTQRAERSRWAVSKIQGAKKHCCHLLIFAQLQVNMKSYTLKSQIMIKSSMMFYRIFTGIMYLFTCYESQFSLIPEEAADLMNKAHNMTRIIFCWKHLGIYRSLNCTRDFHNNTAHNMMYMIHEHATCRSHKPVRSLLIWCTPHPSCPHHLGWTVLSPEIQKQQQQIHKKYLVE